MRRRDPELMRLMHYEGGECALTGSVQNLELHHLLARGDPQASGDDLRCNLVFLERATHRQVTLRNRYALAALGEYVMRERQDFIAYLEEKLGAEQAADWLRRRLLVDSVRDVA